MGLSIAEIICKKRDGFELSAEEIEIFINKVVNCTINDAQTGAMLMAMFLNDLTFNETVNLTKSMVNSGEILTFKNFPKDILIDKHSTGGVGDKVSLILAPALAAVGLKVPMISGRSLKFTGGTLDKLESIPNFQVSLTPEKMNQCLVEAGCFICEASRDFAPADALLYKLRDITSTVDNHGLIVSSILSKKATEGIGELLIDVKFGTGTFSKTEDEARKLAETLIKVGKAINLNTKAIVSEMNSPLGEYVGNALEIVESIKCLKNEINNDLLNLVLFLGGIIVESKGLAKTLEEGKAMIYKTITDGTALKRFEKMLMCQGVSERNATDLCSGNYWNVLLKSKFRTLLRSNKRGVIEKIDSLNIGKACWLLGGGGTKIDSPIDYSAGVVFFKTVGSTIENNEPWIQVHHSDENLPTEVKDLIEKSLIITVDSSKVKKKFSMSLII